MIRVYPSMLADPLSPLKIFLDLILRFVTGKQLLDIVTNSPSYAILRHLRVSIGERGKVRTKVAEAHGKLSG